MRFGNLHTESCIIRSSRAKNLLLLHHLKYKADRCATASNYNDFYLKKTKTYVEFVI